jgi:hypothetical protein
MKIAISGFCVAWMLLVASNAPAVSQNIDVKQKIAACQKTKTEELIAANAKSFTSPEYGLTCTPGTNTWGGCHRDLQTGTFQYSPPKNYVIESAEWKAWSQTERTSVGQLSFNANGASIPLACDGHGCGGQGNVWVKGNILGRLRYQPTVEDTKAIMDVCLDEVLK